MPGMERLATGYEISCVLGKGPEARGTHRTSACLAVEINLFAESMPYEVYVQF